MRFASLIHVFTSLDNDIGTPFRLECTLRLPESLALSQHLSGADKPSVAEWGERLVKAAEKHNSADAAAKLIARMGSMCQDPFDSRILEMTCAQAMFFRVLEWTRNLGDYHLLHRAALIRERAICDAFASLRVPVPGVSSGLLQDFALIGTSPGPAPKQASDAKRTGQAHSDAASREDLIFTRTQETHYCPDVSANKGKETSAKSKPFAGDVLQLPVLIAEWKKEGGDAEQVTNQHYIDLVASVRFLQVCGITDFPVFGLRSNGPILYLDYAYATPPSDKGADSVIIICDRNAFQYDLESPMGVWRFATAMVSINRCHMPRLLCKWEEAQVMYGKAPTVDMPPDHPSRLHGHRLVSGRDFTSDKLRKLPRWRIMSDQKAVIQHKVKSLKERYEHEAGAESVTAPEALKVLADTERLINKENEKDGTDGQQADTGDGKLDALAKAVANTDRQVSRLTSLKRPYPFE